MKRENGYRFKDNEIFETKLHQSYDYKKEGLINRILSRKIYNTNNPILNYILYYYERSLVFCMQYIDILHNYKNYLKNNR